jgi:hypothetical protein
MSFGKRVTTRQPFLERRGAPREETSERGEILIPGKPALDCLVVEYSTIGACLELRSIFGVSDTFDLRAFGKIHPARVVRRMVRTLSVEFRQAIPSHRASRA